MPEAFSYSIVRVVPHVDRGESFNAGVVLFCRRLDFLGARVKLDPYRLALLGPDTEPEAVLSQLDAISRVAAGDPAAGPVASLPKSERFGWLAAPSSTIIQPSESHSGLTDDAEATLEALFARLVS